MAKKGNKLFKLAVVAAAAAGAYYLYKKNNTEIAVDMEDDDDIESFGDDIDIDSKPEKRSYVSLDFNAVEQKVKDAAVKVVDVAGTAASSLGDIIKKGEERVEEFFDDRKLQNTELENSVDDYIEQVAEAAEAVDAAEEAQTTEATETTETTSETFFEE